VYYRLFFAVAAAVPAMQVASQSAFPEKIGEFVDFGSILFVDPVEFQGNSLFERDLQRFHCLGFILIFITVSAVP
jgi:hypothetical protein